MWECLQSVTFPSQVQVHIHTCWTWFFNISYQLEGMNRGVLITRIHTMNNSGGTTPTEWLPALNETICHCLTNVLNLSEKSCQLECGPDIITLIQETIKSESVKGQRPICQAVTSQLICALWRSPRISETKIKFFSPPQKKNERKGFIVLQPCHSRWNVITDVYSGDTAISKGRSSAESGDVLTQLYNSLPSFPQICLSVCSFNLPE